MIELGAISHSRARPIWSPERIAASLVVGRTPGCARQTGQVWTLGSSPKVTAQPQNIFVRVESWTWISSPITGSRVVPAAASAIASAPGPGVEADRLLERMRGVEEGRLLEGGRGELEADRQAGAAAGRLGEAGGNRDRRNAGERHRHREVVVQVHRQRVAGLLPQPEGDRRRCRCDHEVEGVEGGGEVLGDLRAHSLGTAVVGVVVARGEGVAAEHDAPLYLGAEPLR